ncbi:MAG TPA: RHS repeat-associated core domain-containing protein, partial [Pyrinomonadaceae bacterium]
GSVTRTETYNYPLTPNYSLTDAPTYTQFVESWTRDGTNFDSATTSYDVHENDTPRMTVVTMPNGTKSKQLSYNAAGQWNDGLTYQDETYVTDGQPLQVSKTFWEPGAYGSARPYRVEKTDERGQITATEFSYGSVYNQVSDMRDYDYGGTSLIRSTRTTFENSVNYTGSCYSYGCYGRHILNLPLTVEIYASDNVTRVSRTEYQYDGQTLTAAPGVVMHDQAANPWAEAEGYCYWDNDWNDPDCTGNCYDYYCDGYCNQIWVCPYDYSTEYRGNVTQITAYANAASLTGAVTETRRYDVTGNLVKGSSSCCDQTSFNFTIDTQFAYPLSKTRGSATDPYAQVTTSATYDFSTGLGLSMTDANGRQSTSSYDSNSLRLTSAVSPTGARTDYAFDDNAMTATTTTYLATAEGGGVASQNVKYLNGRGQLRQEKALGAGGVWDFVDTTYNNMGQISQQTLPYRSGDPQQWSTTAYDALGRVTTATAPDGSVTQTFYNEATRPSVASSTAGETTRVQDPWGRERWSRTDARNLLVEVVEPDPNGSGSVASNGMVSTYSYNTLGRLTQTTQGSQTRSFKYDALGRLTAQTLAEMSATLNDAGTYVGSGTWSEVFTYDDRNLTSRTDARGVKAVYSYNNDPLNRLQSISWDTTGFGDSANPILSAATISYSYRTKSFGSQLVDVTQPASVAASGVSTESYTYDTEGRISAKTFTLTSRSGYPFVTDYIYDSLDRTKDVRYPAEYGNGSAPRKLVHNDYDVASRASGLTYDGQSQASNIAYNAASQTTSLSVGTGTNQVTENYGYHAQTGLLASQSLTRNGSTLLNLSYDFAGANGKRTGQLVTISNNLDHNKDRGYEYDALGRLKRATGGQNVNWAQRYEYDRYGNRNNAYSFTAEQYVRNFYQNGLNRQPTSTELQSWLSTLQSAYTQGPSQFLAAMQNLGASIFNSQEYANRNRTDHWFVYDLYKTYLYREPDAGGWAFWESQVPTNGRTNVRLGFDLSTEYSVKVSAISPYSPPGGATVPPDGIQGIVFDNASNRIGNSGWNYDAAGNQTRVQTAAGGWQRFQYDAANRLVQVKADDNVTVLATNTYGDSNERVIGEEGGTRTYYDFENGTSIAEYTESGGSTTPAWSRSYVYIGARLLSKVTPNGGGGEAVEFQHPDRLGTRVVTNPSSGTSFEQVTLPFGTALNNESTGATTRRFTSYDRSAVTGLDYAFNRHYDSFQGRFTQVDPIGIRDSDLTAPQSLNLYSYCSNDPVNHSDPSGLGFLSFLKKIGKAILKVLKNKWVQLAIAVAIIVIAHYYPHSLFGALGGGSHAGGTAPVLHGAGATTGLGAAAQGAAIKAAAIKFWGGFTVAELEGFGAAASSFAANAATLALAGGLGAGVATNLAQHTGTANDQQPNKPGGGKFECPGFAKKFFDSTLSILKTLATDLDVSPILIITHASFESGWLDAHNRQLNNLFGYTKAGRRNLRFSSLQAAADTYKEHTGPIVKGAKTADDFLKKLGDAKYNANMEEYGTRFKARMSQVRNYATGCGAKF